MRSSSISASRNDPVVEQTAAPPFSVSYPADLPITEKKDEILRAFLQNQVLVITGETGSGKSTQLPKICLESGHGRTGLIGCTQPRRIAAITLAARVAEELGPRNGSCVGYKIRFQDRTARHTRIKFMTDGILLAEVQQDRLFRRYDTLIIDEAHERSLNIDFLLGLVRRILPRRPDLKVIITSATIDPERFSRAFDHAPIIEVSGRTYPVDVWYRPPEVLEDEEGEVGHIEQAVACLDQLKARRDPRWRGDVLVFMPTESDIRETVQRIEEKRYFNTLVLPLFGRLASSDQQRVFQQTSEEKIIVATNVAETSITIPRIRFVIDTGLARVSQYNPRSRTQGLPVASISRAAADQRKGRCGRVKAGICIRLYSEEDYLHRPLYTPPEILRSNLAEVILRMLFLKLGNVMDFPFIDPPSPSAVKDGFAVLTELGAVDRHRKITPMGRTMARLPLDPRLSRMILAARDEGALREMIVLAAALSIQDCRERPMDFEAQADQAHARFKDPRSDFVSLLKIWNTFWELPQAQGAALEPVEGEPAIPEKKSGPVGRPDGRPEAPPSRFPSRGRMRKFCKDHFLSYRRVCEWYDIHEEIRHILHELGGFECSGPPASYDAVHRSVLSAYLSHIAMKKEKNIYLGIRNRQVMVFPGSGLFNKAGNWIVAAEQVQTSRLFARIVGTIEPAWLEDLGGHLCRSSYSEPHWERNRGQVTAWERVTLYGLPIVERRKVHYGKVNPGEAREIFIRSALVEGDLPPKYGFLEHNRLLMARLEEAESKTRRRGILVDDEAIFHFYDLRIPDLADLRSFDRLLKDREGGDGFLRMTEADLLRTEVSLEALEQFPDSIAFEGYTFPLSYRFEPGTEEDGVTVTLPANVLPRVDERFLRWLVPGLLPEKVTLLLKGLPKNLRKQLVPVSETARRLVELLPFREGDLLVQMGRLMGEHFGVRIPLDAWDEASLPPFLLMRCKVVDAQGKVLGASRDVNELASFGEGDASPGRSPVWEKARKTWERGNVEMDDLVGVSSTIELGTDSLGIVHCAHPGLVAEGERVALRLFQDSHEARRETLGGLMALYRKVFSAELKQLRRAWVFPEDMGPFLFFMGSRSLSIMKLHNYLMREMFDLYEPQGVDGEKFRRNVERLRGRLGKIAAEMIGEVIPVIEERELTRTFLERFRSMAGKNAAAAGRMSLLLDELKTLVPPDFLDHYRREWILDLPRLLRALRIRGERAYAAPGKDLLKEEQLRVYLERYDEMRASLPRAPEEARLLVREYGAMFEEFKISVFAPEVKTKMRVSPARLEEKWREWTIWRHRQNS